MSLFLLRILPLILKPVLKSLSIVNIAKTHTLLMKYRNINNHVEAEPSPVWFVIKMLWLSCLLSIQTNANEELSKEELRFHRMLWGIIIEMKTKHLRGKDKTAKMQEIKRDQSLKMSFKGHQQKLNQPTLLAHKA